MVQQKQFFGCFLRAKFDCYSSIKPMIFLPLLNLHLKTQVCKWFLFPVFHRNNDTDLQIILNHILRPKFVYKHHQFDLEKFSLPHTIFSNNSYKLPLPCPYRHQHSKLIHQHFFHLKQNRAPPFR